MSLIISETSNSFEVAETGIHRAVCCDIVDIGKQVNKFTGEEQDKLRIHWMIEQKMTKGPYAGKPLGVVKYYTKSLHKKSNLRKDLDKWRGRPFTEDELKGFDMEKVIGSCCQLNIMASEKDPENKRFVADVLPDIKGAESLTVPSDYVRAKDRTDKGQIYKTDDSIKPHDSDDDVPF